VDNREGSRRKLAARFCVNPSTITRLLQLRRQTGSRRAGASVLPLPPYSPDYTPIEEMFSKFKGFLRRVGARAEEYLYDAIGEGLRQVTPQDVLGWFRHAGLCATRT
jgi:transposase